MKRLLRRFGVVEMVIGLLLFVAALQSVQFADYNYNRQLSQTNQQLLLQNQHETEQLLQLQGNLSQATRQKILDQFVMLSKHGGPATGDIQKTNQELLLRLNDTIADVNKVMKQVIAIANSYNQTTRTPGTLNATK
jgi:hypothetical protein